MKISQEQIIISINNFINEYEKMDIKGTLINCPYWMNKIKKGKVVLRGFRDGKGKVDEIKNQLIKSLGAIPENDRLSVTPLYLRKLAKRERIGVDCSGFAYRILDMLVRLHYGKCKLGSLDEIFTEGINKTNVLKLTSLECAVPVGKIADIKPGDLVRMMSGKHVLVILEVTNSYIVYAQSSHITKTQGAHRGQIRIIDMNKPLDSQQWSEEAGNGLNFGLRYFHPDNGDGVFRLKIFK